LRSTTRRIYLNGTDGAHVLGSVTLDQDEVETGLEGVERTFDSDLRGEPGFALMLKDSRGRDVEPLEELRPVSGKTLRLTIAMPLQHFTDQRLARAVADTGATSGAAVVIDPVTGEILAMSSYPAFDPNVRPNFLPDNLADKTKLTSDPERLRRFNHAISGSYDPGSVAKLFTFAIGADNAGLIKSSSLPCGSIKIGLKTISDHACSGSTTMETALAQSINVPTINIALQIGAEKFEAALTKFGFGSLTGIELPGESPGVLRAKWQGSYLYHAFGYEYRVTPLQLARACSAIARGGLLPNPTVLLWKQGARGEREHPPRKPSERAVGSGSARDILNMSESVILSGTGTEAKSDSYDAGGKTGTAKRVASGTYVKEYDATFAGMIPLKTPRAVVIVTLHRTRKEAAVTAAPAYRDIAAAAMRYLRVGPDHDIHVPPLARLPEPEVLIPELKAAGTADPQKPQTVGRAMPDLRGKNKREVAAVALAMGFQAEFIGQGVAIHQFPLPGTVLGSEQKVKVQFDR
jgi:cell division protein FtsI (penicillin-binding protein 3)